MICPACGSENESGRRFCGDCGARLLQVCATCGATSPATARFCGDCGAPLSATASPAPTVAALAAASPSPALATGLAPVAERRLVSVLFCDLVGFTGLSEDRDPEAVRELLGRYFDLCREVIGRYGGTIEKFIGDAVMAVWGVPTAHEDDAERAVRAALDLVDVIRGLPVPGSDGRLQARAGVLTGEAAVTLGAVNQGMVAGDLVNTASRIQSVAPTGTVLVGEATREATLGAIAYEAAGDQVLKGKTAPVPVWRALRVVAKIGGVGRSEGLEAPFVGRDEQLRLLKDLLHATGRDRRMRFVSVTGQAGTGKSRLTWEFNKYIDGLVEDVFWHQGRSPSYGEGITFWALGEMVRKRAGLAEGDDPVTTRTRIANALAEYVPDAMERRWIEPKLLALLGLGEVGTLEREELFGAWRTFFERVSDRGTTVLVFEDVQWADQGLIDFIDHLAEWSVGHPILLVTLARPDFLERQRAWGAGRRHFLAMSLDPLPNDAMGDLLGGLVPGLPRRALDAILDRAEGIPLYAVETVRKLLLDGRIEAHDGTYHPVGDLTDLDVPPTLHALIAARLDALDPSLRTLLQDASVLGQTFSVASLAAVSGQAASALSGKLRDLVRQEVLTLNTDPRSPERGQYGFVQAMIREVAYGTLARRDRRARHLAAARHFESLADEETVGALATHYLDAYRASEPGPEADAIAAQARISLRAAAERALALRSPAQALGYLGPAREVTSSPVDRAALLELSGEAAEQAGLDDQSRAHRQAAVETYRALGDLRSLARVITAAGLLQTFHGRADDGIRTIEAVLDEVGPLGDATEAVALKAALARSYLFADDYLRALQLIDEVLIAAERADDMTLITDAVLTKGTILLYTARYREGLVLLSGGLHLAETHGLVRSELRARLNISFLQLTDDPMASLQTAIGGLERARRVGFSDWARLIAGNAAETSLIVGEWERAEQLVTELGSVASIDASELLGSAIAIRALKGGDPSMAADLGALRDLVRGTTASQEQGMLVKTEMLVALAGGSLETVLATELGTGEPQNRLMGYRSAAHAAVWARDIARARAIREAIETLGMRGRWTRGIRLVLDAGIAALEGRAAESASTYLEALGLLDVVGARFDLLLAHLDRIAVATDPKEAEHAADAARPLIAQLGAAALAARLDRLLEQVPEAAARI